MNIIRLLLIAFVIWFIYRLAKKALSRSAKHDTSADPAISAMVRCKHCGLHIPQQEALQRDQEHYCCQAHLEADTKSKAK